MEHKDASLMNKLDYIESDHDMEKIVLKPSVELIPDEYKHIDNSSALVHIFRGFYKHDADNTREIMSSLENIGYKISIHNVHFISTKDQIQKDLDAIAKNTEGRSCLLIFFLDVYKEEDKLILHDEWNDYLTIRDIWINFTGYKCPNLRNKPKIFIFQATKYISSIQRDAVQTNESFYEVPAEADILIIYKKVEEDRMKRNFFRDFCKNIEINGERDDIITLVTQTDHPTNVKTLVVSTLTKKFFFTHSNVRGHHWDLHENHKNIQEILTNLHTQIEHVLIKNVTSPHKAESTVLVKKTVPPRTSSTTATDSVQNVRSGSTKRNVKKAPTEKPPWRY